MTDLRTAAQQALEALRPFVRGNWTQGLAAQAAAAMDRLKAALAEPVLQTCNCRWDGETQVQQCTLHEAHVDAIHEWAERAKTAEKKLAALAEPVQEPVAFKDAPERIWLQACEDDHCEVPFRDHAEITWCAEQQNPMDVQYVRADLAAPPQRKPLTEEEIDAEWRKAASEEGFTTAQFVRNFARAIERAHKIGGEG